MFRGRLQLKHVANQRPSGWLGSSLAARIIPPPPPPTLHLPREPDRIVDRIPVSTLTLLNQGGEDAVARATALPSSSSYRAWVTSRCFQSGPSPDSADLIRPACSGAKHDTTGSLSSGRFCNSGHALHAERSGQRANMLSFSASSCVLSQQGPLHRRGWTPDDTRLANVEYHYRLHILRRTRCLTSRTRFLATSLKRLRLCVNENSSFH